MYFHEIWIMSSETICEMGSWSHSWTAMHVFLTVEWAYGVTELAVVCVSEFPTIDCLWLNWTSSLLQYRKGDFNYHGGKSSHVGQFIYMHVRALIQTKHPSIHNYIFHRAIHNTVIQYLICLHSIRILFGSVRWRTMPQCQWSSRIWVTKFLFINFPSSRFCFCQSAD